MTLEGKQLGRYQLSDLLGIGGMGTVYRAKDTQVGREVAVKVISFQPDLHSSLPDVRRAEHNFKREVEAIKSLDHPHILQLFDCGEAQIGQTYVMYLVMPYRPEGSLAQWVLTHYRDRLLAPKDIAIIIAQAGQALQHAHDRGIIHRDVKPANFLLR